MRSKLIHDGDEKTYALVFDKGEEVASGLLRFAREKGLGASRFTAIGAFERVTLGFFERGRKEYARIELGEQVEVLSLVGDITLKEDGGPQVHAHVVVGRRDGTAHGGHLLGALVWPTLEVIVTESPRHLRRRFDEETGLALLNEMDAGER
jgi:predicted DNA-binding protein with PD1-like motif